MKKILSYVLVLLLCLTAVSACQKKEDENLIAAKNYLTGLYKDKATTTATDYDLVGVVMVGTTKYDVEWTVDVNDGVKIVDNDTMVTIDVNEKTASEINYKLTATVKNDKGQTASVSFDRVVPAFKESGFADYAGAEDGSNVTVKGIVSAIIAKSKGNTANALYVQSLNGDGGYYVYGLATDPVTDDKLEVGMTVEVTGIKTTYNGTLEIEQASVAVLDEKNELKPVDITEIYKNAAKLDDAALAGPQAMLVTVKGVEITSQDTGSGYYRFKLGELESYVRISSSVCPLTKDEQAAFIEGHGSHTGWIADVTGVICVYNGAFYLTPVSANAFTYISLPEKSDEEKVAFEKENLTLPGAATEDITVDLNAVGQSYDKVTIAWASDNDCAVIKDGKLVITLPEEAATVKVTATLTCGSVTATKEFEIKVDSAPTDVYLPTFVENLEADKAYKFALYQAKLGKNLYFTGAMSGNYLATSDRADKAVDVYLETVEGGYRIYFKDGEAKKYIDIYEYTAGKVGVQITDKPTAVFTYNTELKVLVANVAGADYYLGTYNDFSTMSASKTSYISGDKAANVGVTQFPAGMATVAPAKYVTSAVETLEVDKAFKYSLYQAKLGQTLYFTGAMSGNYLATSDRADKAVDVYLEAVEGGYRIYFKDGEAKKYIDIYEYTAGKVGVQITDKPTAVFTYSTELKVLVANVAGADYYLGTYNDFSTMSASKTSYISGDKAANVGVSQFPAQLCTLELKEVAVKVVESLATDTAYKFSLVQAKLGKTLYFAGAMSGNYLATTDKMSKATDVFLETVDGGFKLYFMDGDAKKYIDVYEYTAGKVGVQITDKPTAVFTYNTELKVLVANVAGADYYLGTYNDFSTISASKTSYISGDKAANVGVSQFPAQAVVIEVVE